MKKLFVFAVLVLVSGVASAGPVEGSSSPHLGVQDGVITSEDVVCSNYLQADAGLSAQVQELKRDLRDIPPAAWSDIETYLNKTWQPAFEAASKQGNCDASDEVAAKLRKLKAEKRQ